ncbi:hypothetical protein GLOTRDRAFT_93665 [Gloeophyllum trabeum ATCC 11539]|uniref:Uncharacterized protein n=1 Tax=Gloeophyllum trabeum (strain ATCC 11539 / FP-39264 / Madison 617) TaxID=670483 RepID=S7RL76_GLOTA|nr:uncharacterized protein GLOTRDRAFT_93665 [Gloeophyllum trabeum ATCC 11539]EPQ55130.1 hypothetical protein GLOTRDRAFT_93665 [Gloeophyllum trabeum ATCC 11539]
MAVNERKYDEPYDPVEWEWEWDDEDLDTFGADSNSESVSDSDDSDEARLKEIVTGTQGIVACGENEEGPELSAAEYAHESRADPAAYGRRLTDRVFMLPMLVQSGRASEPLVIERPQRGQDVGEMMFAVVAGYNCQHQGPHSLDLDACLGMLIQRSTRRSKMDGRNFVWTTTSCIILNTILSIARRIALRRHCRRYNEHERLGNLDQHRTLVLPPKWGRKSNAENLRQTFCESGKPFIHYPGEEAESNDKLADDEGSAQMDLSEHDVSNGACDACADDLRMSEGGADDYDEVDESDEDESDEDDGRRTDPDYVEEDDEGEESDEYDEEVHSSKRVKKTTNIRQHDSHPGPTEEWDTSEEQGILSAPSSTSRRRVRLVPGGARSSSDITYSDDGSDRTLPSPSDSDWSMVVYD